MVTRTEFQTFIDNTKQDYHIPEDYFELEEAIQLYCETKKVFIILIDCCQKTERPGVVSFSFDQHLSFVQTPRYSDVHTFISNNIASMQRNDDPDERLGWALHLIRTTWDDETKNQEILLTYLDYAMTFVPTAVGILATFLLADKDKYNLKIGYINNPNVTNTHIQ